MTGLTKITFDSSRRYIDLQKSEKCHKNELANLPLAKPNCTAVAAIGVHNMRSSIVHRRNAVLPRLDADDIVDTGWAICVLDECETIKA